MPCLFKALPYSFSLCQQFASMSMAGQISGNHSQMRRKVNSEAEVPLTGPLTVPEICPRESLHSMPTDTAVGTPWFFHSWN